MRDKVAQVIVADATDKDILEKYAKGVDFAVVSLGEKIDKSLLTTHFLKEIGVKRIIAKASSVDHGKILKILGAHEVVFPERDEAKRLAASLMSPDVLDFIKVSEDFKIVEIAAPDEFVHKSIKELHLRKKYGVNLLAVKNPLTGKVQILPSPDYKFVPDDVLIVIGDINAIQNIHHS